MRFLFVCYTVVMVMTLNLVHASEVSGRNLILVNPAQSILNRRSMESVREVFSRYSGAVYQAYHDALKQNPNIEGALIVGLTIEPSGEVSECTALSSQLNDAKLDEKIINQIKTYNFGKGDYAQWKGRFSINLYPD